MENFSIETGILINIKKRYFFFVNVIMLMLVNVFFWEQWWTKENQGKFHALEKKKTLKKMKYLYSILSTIQHKLIIVRKLNNWENHASKPSISENFMSACSPPSDDSARQASTASRQKDSYSWFLAHRWYSRSVCPPLFPLNFWRFSSSQSPFLPPSAYPRFPSQECSEMYDQKMAKDS